MPCGIGWVNNGTTPELWLGREAASKDWYVEGLRWYPDTERIWGRPKYK